SNATSPLVAAVLEVFDGMFWGRVELATIPIGSFVVVLNPKMTILLVRPLARYAQKKLPLRGSMAPATMPPVVALMASAVTPDGRWPAVSMSAVCDFHVSVARSNSQTVKFRVSPVPPGVWGASAHAAVPPALIPSAFAVPASSEGPTWLAVTGLVLPSV